MLRNVVAIVSGGASGLGAATTSYIIRNGGKVVVADLPEKRDAFLRLAAASCADAAIADGSNSYLKDDPVIAFGEADVTDEDNIISALDLVEEKFGEPGELSFLCIFKHQRHITYSVLNHDVSPSPPLESTKL
eukprot:7916830-Ditylum_brightwellii.AAC.1